jgi:hypothetical protein
MGKVRRPIVGRQSPEVTHQWADWMARVIEQQEKGESDWVLPQEPWTPPTKMNGHYLPYPVYPKEEGYER